uniref:(northern house mosquito) hypothetical protein n=1 Tax=Culex pipiens TaxID=7175 RepID=A0A8D8FZB6_CULPI
MGREEISCFVLHVVWHYIVLNTTKSAVGGFTFLQTLLQLEQCVPAFENQNIYKFLRANCKQLLFFFFPHDAKRLFSAFLHINFTKNHSFAQFTLLTPILSFLPC